MCILSGQAQTVPILLDRVPSTLPLSCSVHLHTAFDPIRRTVFTVHIVLLPIFFTCERFLFLIFSMFSGFFLLLCVSFEPTVLAMMNCTSVLVAEQVSSSTVVRWHGNAASVEWRYRLRRRWRTDPTQLSSSAAAWYSACAHGARSQWSRSAAGRRTSSHRQPAASPWQRQQHWRRRRRQRRRGAFSWPLVDCGQVVTSRPQRTCPAADLLCVMMMMMTTMEDWWCWAAAAAAVSSSSCSQPACVSLKQPTDTSYYKFIKTQPNILTCWRFGLYQRYSSEEEAGTETSTCKNNWWIFNMKRSLTKWIWNQQTRCALHTDHL